MIRSGAKSATPARVSGNQSGTATTLGRCRRDVDRIHAVIGRSIRLWGPGADRTVGGVTSATTDPTPTLETAPPAVDWRGGGGGGVTRVAWFGVYNIALNAGERRVDAGTAAMLIQLAPILIGVLAGLLLGEGFPRRLVIGGLVAFTGTLVIGISTSTGQADVAGVLLVLLSATVYAVAMVAQKVVLRRIPGLQVTWLACVIGAVVCLPFAGSLLGDLQDAGLVPILGVVYLGLVPTALAFSTWAYALSRSTAGKLGVTTFAVPPISIGLGWLFLNEVPVLLAILGGLLSLVGVAIARRT